MSSSLSQKQKMLLRLRDVAQTIDSDLSWIDPDRRRAFLERLEAERDEALDIVLADPPAIEDVAIAQHVLDHLRRAPEDAILADALEGWMKQARVPPGAS
ncbi:hypothetical protein [Salinarimonas rosea]|uniref:hypothetical protein n=1 Tax=Salinarimonas rosea TaxID=552063 RepID=UPI0004220EF1|nr:hypothetical protein [Salinarimonas rosea]